VWPTPMPSQRSGMVGHAAPWFMSSTTSGLKTTKELLDNTTRHTSGKEVVGALSVLGNAGMAASDG
jgi:hypothetical protein